MVCKKDVVTWFKSLKSYKRTDVMCNLLHLCVPFELRFLGTCLEELGKRDFHELRQTETEANSVTELASPELQSITSQRARTKLALYVSLLYSCNYACSNSIYKILTKAEDVNSVLKGAGEELLEDLLLIYTLALNHPAFSFEQKLTLEKIFTRLQEEDRRLYEQSRAKPPFVPLQPPLQETVHTPPLQSYQNCISLEDQQILGGTAGHCAQIPTVSAPPISDQLLHELAGMRMGYSSSLMVSSPTCWGGAAVVSGGDVGGGGCTSPLVSRTSSPSQSNSPSRAGTPPGSQVGGIQGGVLGGGGPPPRAQPPQPQRTRIHTPQHHHHHNTHQHLHQQHQQQENLRETIGKEMPAFTSLHKYNPDQLSRMSDEELRDLGLPLSAITQLRSILTKQVPTNGIGPALDITVKKKLEPPAEPELSGMGRRYPSMEVPMFNMVTGPLGQCYTCVVAPRKCPPPPHPSCYAPPCIQPYRIEPEPSNSSASDTASDHSPPDTPGPPPPQIGSGMVGMVGVGGDDRTNRETDERRSNLSRARTIGRNRSNPPGIQTLPRGRGPNPVHRRREVGSNVANGGGGVEERKAFGGESGGAYYTTTGGNGGGNGSKGGTPWMTTNPMWAGAPFGGGGGAFGPGGAGAFVRHTYPPAFPHPQHNGELVYPYPPPQAPAPSPFAPPPPPIYSPLPVPPPLQKNSCFNCGGQSHIAVDCPESTIEEVTKQGQYRIDYCSSKTGSGQVSESGQNCADK